MRAPRLARVLAVSLALPSLILFPQKSEYAVVFIIAWILSLASQSLHPGLALALSVSGAALACARVALQPTIGLLLVSAGCAWASLKSQKSHRIDWNVRRGIKSLRVPLTRFKSNAPATRPSRREEWLVRVFALTLTLIGFAEAFARSFRVSQDGVLASAKGFAQASNVLAGSLALPTLHRVIAALLRRVSGHQRRVSPHRLISTHAEMAWGYVILGFFHTLCHVIRFSSRFSKEETRAQLAFVRGTPRQTWATGCVLLPLVVLLLTVSTTRPRVPMKLFRWVHTYGGVAAVTLFWAHGGQQSLAFCMPGLALFLLERWTGGSVVKHPGTKHVVVRASSHEGHHVELVLRGPHASSLSSGGEFGQICVPRVSSAQWRPFTLMRGPSPDELTVRIKIHRSKSPEASDVATWSGWMRGLAQRVAIGFSEKETNAAFSTSTSETTSTPIATSRNHSENEMNPDALMDLEDDVGESSTASTPTAIHKSAGHESHPEVFMDPEDRRESSETSTPTRRRSSLLSIVGEVRRRSSLMLPQSGFHWTEKLCQVVESEPEELLTRFVFLDGPHLSPASKSVEYANLVVACAGIGATVAISLMRSIRFDGKRRVPLKRFHFVFVCKDRERDLYAWVEKEFAALKRERGGALDACSAGFYATGGETGVADSPELALRRRVGRADFRSELAAFETAAMDVGQPDVGVFCCGPQAMYDSLREACGEPARRLRFVLHCEVF